MMNYKWLTLMALAFTTPLSALADADQSAKTSPGLLNGRVEQSTENFRLPRGEADTLRSTFSASPSFSNAPTQVAPSQIPPDSRSLQGSAFGAAQPNYGSADPAMIHSMKHFMRGSAMQMMMGGNGMQGMMGGNPMQGMMGGNASMGMMNGRASMGMMHGHDDTSNYGNKSPIWHNTPIGGYVDFTNKVKGIIPGNQLYRYGGWFADGLTPVPSYPLQPDMNGFVDWKSLGHP